LNSNGAGLEIVGSDSATINNNILMKSCSINASQTRIVDIIENQISNGTNISTAYVYNLNIIKNTIKKSNNGIHIINSYNVSLLYNQISENNGYGIYTISSDISESLTPTFINIKNNSITKNDNRGVAIFSYDSVAIQNNLIANNSKNDNDAAGLYVTQANTTKIVNNVIIDNIASQNGGAVYINTKNSLCFVNNTIYGNKASNIAGGVYIDLSETQGTINIYNNIIWGNDANICKDLFLYKSSGIVNIYNNNFNEFYGSWSSESGNINESPLFIDTDNNDYNLNYTSPCINAGSNNAPEMPESDKDGDPRISDNIVDIGAFEHSTTIKHPADTNQDFIITQPEFNTYNQAWRNNTDWQTTQNSVAADFLTRAGYILQKGGRYQNTGARKPLCWVPVE